MLMPPIDRYVTRRPWTVDAGATLAEAYKMMRSHDVRHLPVVDNGKLVGVVSERDLHLLRSIANVSLHETDVREAMSAPVYAVGLSAPLDAVVAAMGDHKYGCAVVLAADGAVAGIFTMVDACRALFELLQRATG